MSMERKHVWKSCVAALGLSVAMLLTGCSEEPSHLALVVMYHDNAPVPDVNLAESAVARVCETGGSVQIIEGDGAPYLLANVAVDAPAWGLSADNRQETIQEHTAQILQVAGQCMPVTEQADPLRALDLAGRALASREGADKQVVMVGSYLMTRWPMDMSEAGVVLSELDPQAVVEALEENGAIPQYLRGVRITWYSIAQTAGKQQELAPNEEQRLKDVWTAIAEAAGAQITFPTDLSIGQEPGEGLPVVNTVNVQPPVSALPRTPVVLDGAVAFEAESTELINLEVVDQILMPLVEILKAEPASCIALFGSTASAGTPEDCREFGGERAQSVLERMIYLGAAPEQILAVGIGWADHELYTPDRLDDGRLDPNTADSNRVVYMMNADTELAKSLIEKFG